MSLFKKYNKTGSTAPTIRVEKIAVKPALTPIPSKKLASPHSRQTPHSASHRQPPKSSQIAIRSTNPSHSDESRLKPRRQLASRKRSPSMRRIESDSDDDDNDSSASFEFVRAHKKAKMVLEGILDMRRDLNQTTKFTSVDECNLIHAADIANLKRKFIPALGATPNEAEVDVGLQYPGGSRCERYQLVYRNGEFDPVEEIIDVVKDFSRFFLSVNQAVPFQNPESGIVRRLERARNIKSMAGFKDAVGSFNVEMQSLRKEGKLNESLRNKHMLPLDIVNRITRQIYDRSVSPNVDLLKKYENGTDFIYGELKTVFVYNILVETGITSDKVFVDLGSGVANVVVQAALQIGCESWGCEIMENACVLADAQKKETEARCRLWGIAPGAVKLERGDFMVNDNIRDALKRADVVLVNNEVFTPQLNNDLVNLFLDLKDGCQIVSLKSFVPHNHKITAYNRNNPVNLLEVEQKVYGSRSVSWKDEGGNYFISKKDSTRLKAFAHLA